MIPAPTFTNSPIYIAAILVLLILFLVLRNPTISLTKYLIKKLKAYNINRKSKNKLKKLKAQKLAAKKEAIMLKKLETEPIIKTKIIQKKIFRQDWTTALFTIIGSGIVINALFKNWAFLGTKYAILEELVYNVTGHMNLTTAIITIVFAGILILIADIFEIFQRSKSIFAKIFTIIFFSALASGILLQLLHTIMIAKLNLTNTIIIGTIFIISGFLFNYKKIFRKEKKIPKQKEEIIIKEISHN